MSELKLHPQVAEALKTWHSMVASGDLSQLPKLLASDVVFRSPMAHTQYEGSQVATLILMNVSQVFQDFQYHRELATADGLSVVEVRPVKALNLATSNVTD